MAETPENVLKEKVSLTFPKSERLRHRSLVEGLFREGKSFYEFPFRVTWRVMSLEKLERNFRNNVPEGIGKMQMMITVPKKKRRHATDRVQMRRRIRESYRLNRVALRDVIEKKEGIGTLSIAFVYIHDKNLPYISVEEKMRAALLKLTHKIIPAQ